MKNYKKLYEQYKELYEQNIKHHNDLQKERLEDYILNDRLKKDVDLLHNKINEMESKISKLYEYLQSDIDRMIKLNEKIDKLDNICVEQYDVLETKNYQLKVDMDRIIEYLNTEAERMINEGTAVFSELSKMERSK